MWREGGIFKGKGKGLKKKLQEKLAIKILLLIIVCEDIGFPISPDFYPFIYMSMVSNTPLSRVLSQRLQKRLSGFTLVELIVVVVILALLGTIGLVSFS